ncbi:CrcB family protein [Cellulomonas sp. APG4]|uniref:fluoride efflux transporter FluC n=1 Tax=Cellulomonas sp. APG4 TaxID=1538656 RepID=UPI00137A037A|nr:CrcB family protein [Cellulomonas sp. APG4]NCT89375.1 CrcB family protein [Cellulomonas sp. APG4]
MTELLLVALLGGVGAATRFVVDGAIRARRASALPLATLLINVSGSAVIGALTGAHLFHGLHDGVFTAAAVGFCGGYTTFSTAMVETVRLVQGEEYRRAAVYVLGSLALSLAAAALGVLALWLTR